MKQQAIDKIKNTPNMYKEVTSYGGFLMFDRNKGGIFHCNDDDKTYYQKWHDDVGKFIVFEWRLSGLDGLDLEILESEDYL